MDDYQQAWDPLREQRRSGLWEQAVAQSGIPRYLGAPDDLKLLLMKAINRKSPGRGYRVHDGNRLSFQGRWYVCPGLLNRLQGREFEVYYDRRDVSVLYLFVEGRYVGEAYCPQFLGRRVSEWEAEALKKYNRAGKEVTAREGRESRARIQAAVQPKPGKQRRSAEVRAAEQSRQWDRQREEIHPAGVLEVLQGLRPPRPDQVPLPKAVPDPAPDRPVRALRVRPRREEPRP